MAGNHLIETLFNDINHRKNQSLKLILRSNNLSEFYNKSVLKRNNMFERSTYINRRNALKDNGLKGIALIIGNVDSPMNCVMKT